MRELGQSGVVGMAGRQRNAQARRAGGHGRRPDRRHPQAVLIERGGELERLFIAADDQRLHGGMRIDGWPWRVRENGARALDQLSQVCASLIAFLAVDQRRLADTACATAGADAVVKMYGRARCTNHSITVSCAITKAPETPAALPSVPT